MKIENKLVAKKIYISSKLHEVYDDISNELLCDMKARSAFVIDFAREGESNLQGRKERDRSRLLSLGFEKVAFASDLDDAKIGDKMITAEVIFIFGGTNVGFLLSRFKELDLDKVIADFKGIIVGNSAGAYLLCKKYFKIREDNINTIQMLGFFDFSCKVHYNEKFDGELLKLSSNEKIYAVENESYIIVEGGAINFRGGIYLFNKGKRVKIS